MNRPKSPNPANFYQRVHWEHEHGRDNKSSIQILLDWIKSNDNNERWKSGRSSRKHLKAEAMRPLLVNGIESRSKAEINAKIRSLEKSMTLAKRLLTENGLRGLVSIDLCTNMQLAVQILRCCPYFRELAPVMTPAEDQQRFLSQRQSSALLVSNLKPGSTVFSPSQTSIGGNNVTDYTAAEVAADTSMGDYGERFEFIGVKQESGVQQVSDPSAQNIVHEVPSQDQILVEHLQLEAEQDRYDFERKKRRIELVVEKTLARQKLLQAGVSLEDVNRLLPESA